MPKKHRIIIDTNLWIHFLISKKFDFIDNLLENGSVQLIFCWELLDEFMEIAQRPKLKRYFTEAKLKLISTIIERYAVFLPVTSTVTLCRDAKDNFLLALAKDTRANYLITGDKDLLIIKKFEDTQIVTIAEYIVERQSFTTKNIKL
ncbi:MAG: putative toxin-antitoxin system toxin component, PIN family [Bacteroidales bacterium]|jgi:putative PIN family toxin of toxin-antitoxin system|nr:putative toxin-antitoxin system toxin component, PIN family [Bacteroidales bacterium]